MKAKFIFILTIFSLNIVAQDVIITKDSQRINAKIDEVGTNQMKKPCESINIKRWFGVTVGWVFKERVYQVNGDMTLMDRQTGVDYGTVRDMKETSYGNTLQVGFTFSPSFKYGLGLYSGVYYEHTWAMKQELTWIAPRATTQENIDLPIVITEEQTLSDGTKRRWFGSYVNSLYIPIHFQYQYNINPNMKLAISAGPSFEVGLNEPNYRYNKSRFNLLMGGRVGFQMYGAQISIATEWGVIKENFGNSTYAHYHRPISIQLSYMF